MRDRLLIDECLSVELVKVANELGFEAHHVVRLGLAGASDSAVFTRACADGFVLVTNNRDGFLALVRRVDLHADLVVILPSCRRETQRLLLEAALRHITAAGGMTNSVLEIDDQAAIRTYSLPEL